MKKRKVTAIITDLDNTLYDWFKLWYRCFKPMLDKIVKISGIPEEKIIEEIRTIHQKYGTAEYAFLIEELPSLKKKHKGGDLNEIYKEAVDIYRKNRRKYLKLYPSVMDTLVKIKESGCLIVGYTESKEFYTNYRIRKLNLDGIIDVIYSPKDHKLPKDLKRKYPAESYKLNRTVHKYIEEGEYKPNPRILLDIIKDIGVPKDEVIYIGDSLVKDILMAKHANVLDVYAKYGKSHHRKGYKLLREVTHWTKEMVEKEKDTNQDDILPSYTLKRRFSDILNSFEFQKLRKNIKINNERIAEIVKIWNTTIEVQKHFNELEMKIRNYAITVFGAILGLMVLILKDNTYTSTLGQKVPISLVIDFISIMTLFAFFFMDRFWYHKLLIGSVKHAERIEEYLMNEIPEIRLTKTISEESPSRIFKIKIHSSEKFLIFYGILAIGLFLVSHSAFRI